MTRSPRGLYCNQVSSPPRTMIRVKNLFFHSAAVVYKNSAPILRRLGPRVGPEGAEALVYLRRDVFDNLRVRLFLVAGRARSGARPLRLRRGGRPRRLPWTSRSRTSGSGRRSRREPRGPKWTTPRPQRGCGQGHRRGRGRCRGRWRHRRRRWCWQQSRRYKWAAR